MPQIKTRALELIKTIKSGEPVLNLRRSIAADTLWPTSLEKEAEKAASLLRSFFIDGFIVPYRTLGTCPQQVIRDARGLAVFHVLRAGLHSPSGSGSGVAISRLPNGKWSGASAIVVDYNLPEGIDVADIVLVVNGEDGFGAMSSPGDRLTRGHTIKSGPIPQSDVAGAPMRKMPRSKDVSLFYAKSKGELIDLDLRNLVIREANGENERYYGVPGVASSEILSGQVRTPSGASHHLYSTLSAIDQQSQNLSGISSPGKCPGDYRVRAPTATNATP